MGVKPRLKLRTVLMYVTVVGISGVIIFIATFMIGNLGTPKEAQAALNGDYRSIASGNWNNTAIWEKYNGTNWVAAITTPTSADGTITIQSGSTITISAVVIVDQIVIDAGGTLNISSATTVANGTASDVIVNGTLNISNTLSLSSLANMDVNSLAVLKSGGTMSFLGSSFINVNGRFRRTAGTMSISASYWSINNGGVFEHAINGGSLLPSASWKTGSTCEVTGITTTMPANINQIFHHFTWNCPGQLAGFDFNARFDWVNGNLTIIATGASTLQFDYQGNNNTTNIGGNLVIQGGTSYGCANGSGIFNIGGNYIQTGGIFSFNQSWANSYGNTSITLNIVGNLIMSGGLMDMTQSTANNPFIGIGHINLDGNIYLSGTALITETSPESRGQIHFAGTAIQTYDLNNLVSNTIDFIVDAGATVQTNLNVITSGGDFILMDGGHLMIASPQGITKTIMQGNIQVTGIRTYGTGSDYTYEAVSPQVSGDGLPATLRNISFNNVNNVTLTNSCSATNLITLTNGKVITGSNILGTTNASTTSIVGYTSSKYIVGNLRRSINATGSYDFPVGVITNYELANINLTAATGFTSILGFFTNAYPIETDYPVTNIYVNGNSIGDMLNYGYWTFSPNSVMSGGTYAITLNEKGHTNSSTPQQYCVLKRNNTLASWQSVGVHNDNTQYENDGVATAVRSALTSFSHFGIGKMGSPLPVTLINFAAKAEHEKTVLLSWATIAEKNNDYFTIERSQDGEDFLDLARVEGAGSSTEMHKYQFIDEQPFSGISYYRLRQTDFDGKSETFKTVSVTFNSKLVNTEVRISPNPFSESFTLQFECSEKEKITIMLFASNGAQVYTDKILSEEGNNLYRFEAPSNFKPGTYFLKIADEQTILASSKVICKR